MIDSGVNMNHVEFGTRAKPGFDAYRASSHADFGKDCDGHGTHVAGILGGKTFGVAKAVDIVSVRVLDCNASGSVSNVVAGINYVTGQKQQNPGKAMVANMSLGGSANTALDQAVRNSITAGVTYSIAAGNGNVFGSGQNACNVSPARVTEALTVGATDTSDRRTAWSNYGSCVDVYAPGNNIVSSYGETQNTTAWASLSGTSMAAPAVAAAAALLLQQAPGASPVKGDEHPHRLGHERGRDWHEHQRRQAALRGLDHGRPDGGILPPHHHLVVVPGPDPDPDADSHSHPDSDPDAAAVLHLLRPVRRGQGRRRAALRLNVGHRQISHAPGAG